MLAPPRCGGTLRGGAGHVGAPTDGVERRWQLNSWSCSSSGAASNAPVAERSARTPPFGATLRALLVQELVGAREEPVRCEARDVAAPARLGVEQRADEVAGALHVTVAQRRE